MPESLKPRVQSTLRELLCKEYMVNVVHKVLETRGDWQLEVYQDNPLLQHVRRHPLTLVETMEWLWERLHVAVSWRYFLEELCEIERDQRSLFRLKAYSVACCGAYDTPALVCEKPRRRKRRIRVFMECSLCEPGLKELGHNVSRASDVRFCQQKECIIVPSTLLLVASECMHLADTLPDAHGKVIAEVGTPRLYQAAEIWTVNAGRINHNLKNGLKRRKDDVNLTMVANLRSEWVEVKLDHRHAAVDENLDKARDKDEEDDEFDDETSFSDVIYD
jgi:hypothetical protein